MLDPDFTVAYCSPPNGQTFTIHINTMVGYACFSLEDTQTLSEWIKRHSKGSMTTHYRVKLMHEIEKVVYAQNQVANAVR